MTLEQTKRRRQAVATIHEIVGAMRAIAAGRIQGAQRAVASSRRYEDVVLRAMLALTPETAELAVSPGQAASTVLLVMTSEQPLCGSFNQNVLALAERRLRELAAAGEVHLVVVGQRGARQLAARGILPNTVQSAATSVQGLRDVVKRLAAVVDSQFAAGKLGALHAVYNRYQSISEQVPADEQIVPIDLERIRAAAPPVTTAYDRQLPVSVLLSGLISQYAFIRLYRIAADSFASEQAARLVAMDGATRNTEKTLESLIDLEHRERQGEITRQVLELIAARIPARG